MDFSICVHTVGFPKYSHIHMVAVLIGGVSMDTRKYSSYYSSLDT